MRRVTLLIVVVLWALTTVVGASYLEQAYERTPPDDAPPERSRENLLRRVIRGLRVREGCTHRGLMVFLLELPDVQDHTPYASVEEALATGALEVRETQQEEVSALRVRNGGRQAVLMLAGEMLLGGKQNRILRDDVLLSPRSGWVRVPVACVERRRWSKRSQKFRRRVQVAPQRLRAASQSGRSQDGIWRDVRRYHETFGVESESRDLAALRNDGQVRETLRDHRRHFQQHCWRADVVGMVVARRGRIAGADVFCNPRVFRKHRNRLLDSYVIDSIVHPPREAVRPPEPVPIDEEDARRFLRRALRARITRQPGHGSGERLSVEGNRIRGAGLIYAKALLHAALYPRRILIALPPHPIEPPRPAPGPAE